MNELPVSVQRAFRRLSRRLAVGLFLDVWPGWAVSSLLLAGVVVIACRLFVPGAASRLPWLWIAPVLTVGPALAIAIRRSYRPAEVVALADSLSGGHGRLLTLLETHDPAWAETPAFARASTFPLPQLRPWRALTFVAGAAAFLAVGFWLPQRQPAGGSTTIVADEIAANLSATVAELKQQSLVTAAEEEKLEEAIERIRQDAKDRVDASSWEAADALRERLVSDLAAKQDALKWAEASLARVEAAAGASEHGEAPNGPQVAELAAALQKLSESGLLAGAPADLQQQLKAAKLPGDAKSLKELAASLSKYLGESKGRMAAARKLGKEFGRFDPSEFPLDDSAGSGNEPGWGGIDRGRADAPLTWGQESLPIDRFKAQPLPAGAARPDDWAPLVELPGAPRESPVSSTAAAARDYAAAAGQTAWRRTLAPRHQSAVKKYFAK